MVDTSCTHCWLSDDTYLALDRADRKARRLTPTPEAKQRAAEPGPLHDELAAALAEYRAAAEQIKSCVLPDGHGPNHRDADGHEWTDPDEEHL